jgi:hypothetical protein
MKIIRQLKHANQQCFLFTKSAMIDLHHHVKDYSTPMKPLGIVKESCEMVIAFSILGIVWYFIWSEEQRENFRNGIVDD